MVPGDHLLNRARDMPGTGMKAISKTSAYREKEILDEPEELDQKDRQIVKCTGISFPV
jgi:hypothetical protein